MWSIAFSSVCLSFGYPDPLLTFIEEDVSKSFFTVVGLGFFLTSFSSLPFVQPAACAFSDTARTYLLLARRIPLPPFPTTESSTRNISFFGALVLRGLQECS